jgi:hypothetical protein
VSFTLACVMVRGRNPDKAKYQPIYIERLRNMVARHTDLPFRTVCLTDNPPVMPNGVEAVRVRNPRPYSGWWAKMNLFNPAMPFEGRVLYLDLDTLVVGDLAPIINFPADFAIAPDSAPTFQGKGKLKTVKGYQSSVMVWDHGARSRFYTGFDRSLVETLYGDQDALAHMSPGEKTFPPEWFVRLGPDSHPFDPKVKVALCIRREYKNVRANKTLPWFKEYWR